MEKIASYLIISMLYIPTATHLNDIENHLFSKFSSTEITSSPSLEESIERYIQEIEEQDILYITMETLYAQMVLDNYIKSARSIKNLKSLNKGCLFYEKLEKEKARDSSKLIIQFAGTTSHN